MPAERPSMAPFGRYAAFYDALYADKNYRSEVRYLERLFDRYAERPVSSVLSLGCGTGSHDVVLAQHGFVVTGVDRSAGMLAAYRAKAKALDLPATIRRADLRTVRLGRRFDVVIAMFAVFGYQTSNRDLARALETSATHLRRGGVLVFDVWYGPAVLRDPPGDREKSVRIGDQKIVRRTESRLDEVHQIIDVTFHTERWAGRRRIERFTETHPMRFFFPRELELALSGAGLEPLLLAPFGRVTGHPGAGDWVVTLVARRRSGATALDVARRRRRNA